ncbi:agouti-related protein [Candoia aspera]|uniref:agouti-related protein n=1 Tax=Candoia aspera TaxID=51853 RepID=UPI002FD86943
MLRRLLLSLGLLQVALALLASSHSRLDERGPIMEDAGRPNSPSLTEMFKEVHVPDFKQVALEMPIAQDDLVPEAGMMMMSAALQAQQREARSPRRCVRIQESCLGHKLPCCDPCATCYCRFFNANCFCKKFSSTFPCGRN